MPGIDQLADLDHHKLIHALLALQGVRDLRVYVGLSRNT
jgi:hypothetical protein